MVRYMARCMVLGIFAGCVPLPAISSGTMPGHSDSQIDEGHALEFSQSAIGKPIGNHALTDSSGNPIELGEFRGKPLVVSMIYTSCYHTCPMLTRSVSEAVRVARSALGEDSFSTLTVGFDTAVDTPQRMAEYASERSIDDVRWTFASTSEQAIAGLSADLGFIFQPSPKGFDHLAQTTVIDSAGVVRNQIYGEAFEPPLLAEALMYLELRPTGQPATSRDWLRNIKLLCTVYDPTLGRYRFDYSLVIAIFTGMLCLGAVAVFIIRAWLESRQLSH